MAIVVCDQCGVQSTVSDTDQPQHCTGCGVTLAIAVTDAAAATLFDNDRLAADLRDAFGMGVGDSARGGSSSARLSSSGPDVSWQSPFCPPLRAQSRLADFEIIDELGRGGMGIVYRARQLSLDREVALKVLPNFAPHDDRLSLRFQTEAKAAARLNHTNVVPVYAQGEHEGQFYYAMKLVEGSPLDAVIKSHPELLSSALVSKSATSARRVVDVAVSPSEEPVPNDTQEHDDIALEYERSREDFAFLARLMAEVADGLAHAHTNGVLHRDIKPHNLIFGLDRRLYITDFGLAYVKGDPHMTVAGEIMGTPPYISPEQARGDVGNIDVRTDIFSLGVTLYEVTTGRRPFGGETRDQILHAVCNLEPPRLRAIEPRIPCDLEIICLKAIEKNPADRYQTADAIAEDLRRFSDGRPILARRTGFTKRAAKWIRRRPALSSAMAAATALIGVTIGWTLSVSSAQYLQATQHLDAAYHQLVHLNFHKPAVARDELIEAEALGASGPKFDIVTAFLELLDRQTVTAIERLNQLLEENPEHAEALYLLAWAQRRDGRFDESRETRRRADAVSGQRTPEESFLRALAAYRTDPPIAIESFKLAIRLSAATDRYFPQAWLHLARARNQQMYHERTLEPFADAQQSLEQLIKQGQYAGYPYYLISITHRLAGEIYESGLAEGGVQAADQQFAFALDWSRDGQEIAPDDELPIMAEAMVLERMGRLDEALEARNRAIEAAADRAVQAALAGQPAGAEAHQCESYHYRWRLEYWLGLYDEAIEDIERHAVCVPDNPYYRYIYPALVYAEMGQFETAFSRIEQLLADEPENVESVLLAAMGLRLLGYDSEATALLVDRFDDMEFSGHTNIDVPAEWQKTLYAFSTGQVSIEALEELALMGDSPRRTMGEAYFHAAIKSLSAGHRQRAIDDLRKAYRAFDGAMGYTYLAKLLLYKIGSDEAWPSWFMLESGSNVPVESGVRTPASWPAIVSWPASDGVMERRGE